jgi:hypothetical protein
MPYYKSRAERERANWRTLPEAVDHVCTTDGCLPEEGYQQIRAALADGQLGPLLWANRQPSPRRVGGAAVESDDPPSPHRHWRNVKIDWKLGTVLDDFDYTEAGRPFAPWRMLLIHRVALKSHWPDPVPDVASPGRQASAASCAPRPRASDSAVREWVAGSRDTERKKRGRRPEKLNAATADMLGALKSGKHTPESLRAATQESLAAEFGASRTTTRTAREAALSEFVQK